MTALDRLLAETIPTRPAPAPTAPRRTPAGHQWTREQQDAHWNALCDAIGAPKERRPGRPQLRVITTPAA